MGTESKTSIKGMRIRTLNLSMIVVSCILYILLLVASTYALQEYKVMVSATENYVSCQKNALLLAEGSDYQIGRAHV